MSRQFCKYHPLEPALWYNPRTHVPYCERCVDSSESAAGFGTAVCFLTGEELQYLGGANTAQPFWDRLGLFFRFPLHRNSLLMLVFFVLLTWGVLASLELSLLPVLLVGGLFLLACVTRYGFLIIEHSASGRFEPPSLTEALSGSGLDVLFQQVIMQVVFVGFVFLVGKLNSAFLDVVAQATVLFVWPASMMLLATEKSVTLAVSPSAIWHFIRSIGWAYLLLYGFLFLLIGAQTAFYGIFAHEVAPLAFIPVFVAITLYFMMVSYHLMGYVVFQYQAEIGFVAEDQLARQKRRITADPVHKKVDLLVKEGQYEKAVSTLNHAINQQKRNLNYHEKLSRLLRATQDREQALAHGQHFLTLLNEIGDISRIYFLYSDLQKIDQHFLPDDPDVCLCLAHQMYQRGKYKQTCQLMLNMHKRAPRYQRIPEAYLLMARALMDGFENKQKAVQYLRYIQTTHPEFEQMDEVEQLLATCLA